MRSRLDIDSIFRTILESGNVYFQPPESLKMNYPCIRYKLNGYDSEYADNNPYKHDKSYIGTVISKNADLNIIDEILQLPKCRFDRYYTADNLHHWVFIIYE